MHEYRPFLVADRPASLRIIRGADVDAFDSGLGIMTHANVSSNVRSFVRDFPSSSGFYDGEEDDPCSELQFVNPETGELTERGKSIQSQTTTMCDSGVFLKEGSNFDNYHNLFATYEKMKVDYGIIIDVLNDADATLNTAQDAIDAYKRGDYSFGLVGVAQGTTPEEYLECYRRLRDQGYQHLAIGGLLDKYGERSGAFAHVDDEKFVRNVLDTIRTDYPNDWLFVLGCHHPTRQSMFKEYNVIGSDYKGWIYKYEKRSSEGKIAARQWRYKQVRSFLRHNILTNSFANGSRRLLILSCSQRKRDDSGFLPAINRYDGVYYRTLKKQLEETDNLDVLILSAKHGLIPAHFEISNYDERLPSEPSKEFRAEVRINVKNYLRYRDYGTIFVAAGRDYRKLLLDPLCEFSKESTTIRRVDGRLGRQLKQLKGWLQDGAQCGEIVQS